MPGGQGDPDEIDRPLELLRVRPLGVLDRAVDPDRRQRDAVDHSQVEVVAEQGGNGFRVHPVEHDPEPAAVLELSEEQARKIGAVLAGTYFVD